MMIFMVSHQWNCGLPSTGNHPWKSNVNLHSLISSPVCSSFHRISSKCTKHTQVSAQITAPAHHCIHGVSQFVLLGFVSLSLSLSNAHPVLAEIFDPQQFTTPETVYDIATLTSDASSTVLQDFARVLNPAKSEGLINDIQALENETGWKLRVLTKSGSVTSITGKDLKDLWKPDEKTVIVIEDLTSPNILNFNTGSEVSQKLPRQFFTELQSRYGNQFFVAQEGEGAALLSSVQALNECLRREEGCKNVPGLTGDLYNLTFATSIAGGCVFGFAARLPPSGRVEASWQWLLLLSPLWLLLFGAFGILPVVGRTSDLEPIVKNGIGFAVGAAALYLTPIFGPSPISKE